MRCLALITFILLAGCKADPHDYDTNYTVVPMTTVDAWGNITVTVMTYPDYTHRKDCRFCATNKP